MSLVVVGGSGYIGRNFLAAVPSELDVTATYRSDEGFPAFVRTLSAPVKTMRCDLLDEGLDFSGFDTAVYLAGNNQHGWSVEHPSADLAMNTLALTRFLESFRGRLVLLSSAAVYLGHQGVVSPKIIPSPSFPYAISKLAGELYAQWAASVGRLSGAAILRLYYAYGPGEEERRLVRRALIRFGVLGEHSLTINGNGKSMMGPLHVTDLARALNLVVRAETRNGTFDVLGERSVTVNELVQTAASVCGISPELRYVDTDEPPLLFEGDPVPFEAAFGFRPRWTLRDGMTEYLGYLRAAV